MSTRRYTSVTQACRPRDLIALSFSIVSRPPQFAFRSNRKLCPAGCNANRDGRVGTPNESRDGSFSPQQICTRLIPVFVPSTVNNSRENRRSCCPYQCSSWSCRLILSAAPFPRLFFGVDVDIRERGRHFKDEHDGPVHQGAFDGGAVDGDANVGEGLRAARRSRDPSDMCPQSPESRKTGASPARHPEEPAARGGCHP